MPGQVPGSNKGIRKKTNCANVLLCVRYVFFRLHSSFGLYRARQGQADSFFGRQFVYYLAGGMNGMAGWQPDMPK